MIQTILATLLLIAADADLAEREYRAGRYEQAEALYQAALAEPEAAQGPLLYDLGNCAYRLGRHAEAVLCYRRALLRLPRDRETRVNLRLAEQRLGLEPTGDRSAGLALLDAFPPGVLLLGVFGLQTVGLLGLLLLRRRAARIGMAILVLLSLPGAVHLVRTHWIPGPPQGVVLVEEIGLRPEPHSGLAVLCELEAGETLRIEELSDRWMRVAHPRGGGWTERAGVGVVD